MAARRGSIAPKNALPRPHGFAGKGRRDAIGFAASYGVLANTTSAG